MSATTNHRSSASDASHRKRIVVVQRVLRRYREPFFDQLRDALSTLGMDLELIFSNPPAQRDSRQDAGSLPWATKVPRLHIRLRGRELIHQPIFRRVRGADLVIVEQASRNLTNYPLLAWQWLGGPKLALWGHGAAFEDTRSGLSEWLKRRTSTLPHWWFAYNSTAFGIVEGLGFPRDRITLVDNSSDTARLRRDLESVDDVEIAGFREEHDLGPGPLLCFVGALQQPKRLDFLFAAVDHLHERRPDVRLILVGMGEERAFVETETARRPWCRYLGPRFDHDLAVVLRSADLLTVPAWAGLVITDSFAAGVPLVASHDLPHPPEIDYLQDGVNGRLVRDGGDPAIYAAALQELVDDEALRRKLGLGGEEACEHFSTAAMVDRFVDGIVTALGLET